MHINGFMNTRRCTHRHTHTFLKTAATVSRLPVNLRMPRKVKMGAMVFSFYCLYAHLGLGAGSFLQI